MSLGYLVNTYPRASHSFIRREIAALERAGLTVHRFAMRSDRGALQDPADLAEDGRTEHILQAGGLALARGALGWLARHPRAALAGLSLARRLGRSGRGAGVAGTGGVLRHLVYLAEAAYLAARCQSLGIRHLHAHFGTNSTAVAALVQALGGPGYSFTVHGPEEFDAPQALALGEKIARARFVVAISSFGRSQLCRWCPPQDWPKLHIVHCGIEPSLFTAPKPPAAAADPAAGPRLVAIGRLAPQKGFGLLPQALSLAASDLPGLTLTLVGDGPLRPQIEAEIAKIPGLSSRITLAGWQDEAGVRAALMRADALILPSFAEGLPVVLMEALAAARPVIATAIAGIPELVTAEVGWLVPAGDAQALADAIAGLAATDPARRDAMGLAGRERVLKRHDIDCEAARLARLFRDHS